MKISIVIPTYNGEKYIELALKSVLNQTRLPYEIIISDDNSKDGTIAICKKYSDYIKIYQNPNGPSGFVNGWNNAIAHANGNFISILHQDDILAPNFVEEIERAYKLYPGVKQFVTPCNYIDSKGNVIRKSGHLSNRTAIYKGTEYSDIYILNGRDHINRCPGVVTHKDIFKYCKYRPEAGHIADDDFFTRVGNYTDIVCIHKPLAFYREHSSSETGHLDNLTLNKRLLKCYEYQITQLEQNPILSREAKIYIRKEECKFLRRVLVGSLKCFKILDFLEACKYSLHITIRDKGKNIPFLFTRHRQYY
jgi:glycosyltransferase involved in cell wall biosynthesis